MIPGYNERFVKRRVDYLFAIRDMFFNVCNVFIGGRNIDFSAARIKYSACFFGVMSLHFQIFIYAGLHPVPMVLLA